MKAALSLLLVVTVFCAFALTLQAAPKEVTLKGEILCAKCELKQGNKCQTVIRVKEEGKEVTYYFKDKGNKEEYHESVCGGGTKEGTVIGTVTEKNGKKWITPTKVEYAQK
jgi:hypothetical protein